MQKRNMLILEDEQERIDRFLAVLGSGWLVKFWRNVHLMIQEAPEYLKNVDLISLDHDLYVVNPNEADPGDGLDVAKWLAEQKPTCPVIVHSSNSDRAHCMLGEFELGGWQAKYVYPVGDDWIESYWIKVVNEFIDLHNYYDANCYVETLFDNKGVFMISEANKVIDELDKFIKN